MNPDRNGDFYKISKKFRGVGKNRPLSCPSIIEGKTIKGSRWTTWQNTDRPALSLYCRRPLWKFHRTATCRSWPCSMHCLKNWWRNAPPISICRETSKSFWPLPNIGSWSRLMRFRSLSGIAMLGLRGSFSKSPRRMVLIKTSLAIGSTTPVTTTCWAIRIFRPCVLAGASLFWSRIWLHGWKAKRNQMKQKYGDRVCGYQTKALCIIRRKIVWIGIIKEEKRW